MTTQLGCFYYLEDVKVISMPFARDLPFSLLWLPHVYKLTLMKFILLIISAITLSLGCQERAEKKSATGTTFTFQDDIQFLKEYVPIDVLLAPGGSGLVACTGALQGRVMTSSATGLHGPSFGWINRSLFKSGDTLKHINPYGGEERFWLGPEGGQYAIFFEEGDPFTLETWQTPRLIDLTPFERIEKNKRRVSYRQTGLLTNYSGTKFNLQITRSIEILSPEESFSSMGLKLYDLNFVAYRSNNEVKNIGENAWTKAGGLLSIWLLGMFNPTDQTTVIMPYQEGTVSELGPIVNDAYFGKVPKDRLTVKEGIIYFIGDGKHRSKIGLSPRRSKDIFGSYAAESQTLTLIKFSLSDGTDEYVNSMWEMQDQPYAGDAINTYNDGPPAPGAKPLGPFYELETSSPALALAPGESGMHEQITMHLTGDLARLNEIVLELFGISIEQINDAL